MALSKGQRASRTQEARGAKMHGGSVTPRSGAGWAVKGDVRQPSTGELFEASLIEFKYTGKKTYTIKAAELEKNVYEAIADGRQPAFGIELNGQRYIIQPEDDYLEQRSSDGS